MRTAAPLRILILGGSSEASALVAELRDKAGISPVLSLAGRTIAPAVQPVPTRIGGFGGAAGLAVYLREKRIDVLVDATHPFAAQMSRNAREAAAATGCSLIAVTRPPWTPQTGDDWHEVPDAHYAAIALGRASRRVFLTVGRLQLAAFSEAQQHRYLVRTIDPIGSDFVLPQMETIEARGPFEVDAEERLLADHRIDVLVTKNSGGTAARGKLDAARRVKLPVILIRRPDAVHGVTVDEAVSLIDVHRIAADRGV